MNRVDSSHTTAFVFLAAAVSSLLPASVRAVERGETPDASEIDEVLVTAQRREQRSQDVGASIAVLGGERLTEEGLGSGADIVNLVSGVQAASAYGSQPVFQIRGVGASDFQIATPPAAGVYSDGVFLSTNVQAGQPIFDMDRVEVLKGPQGTLYGRNSSAGAINYLSKAPTRMPESYLTAGFGRFDRRELQGATSGPLGERFAYRLSGQLVQRDSPLENVSVDPRFVAGSNDAGGTTDGRALRAQLAYSGAAGSNARFIAHYSQEKGTSPNPKSIPDAGANCPGRIDGAIRGNIENPACVADANLGNRVRSPTEKFTLGVGPDGIQPVDNAFYGVSAEVNIPVGVGTLTSLTAYEGFHNDFGMDYDGLVEPILNLGYQRNLDQYSQEIRLAGEARGIHWLVGAYGSYEKLDQDLLYWCGFLNPTLRTGSCNYFGAAARAPAGAPLPTSRANSVGSTWERETTAAAVFTHNEIPLAEHWSAIVGGRYTLDDVNFAGRGYVIYDDGSQQINNQGNVGPAIGSSSFTVKKFTGTLGLNYKPSDRLLAYLSYGQGFKSGGYEGSIFNNITGLSSSFKPETVRALEVGLKAEPTRQLRVNLSAFYQLYDDPQARIDTILPLPGGGTLPTTALSNLHEAVVYGVESEIQWVPATGLTLGSSLTFYHSRIDQPFDPAKPTLNPRFDGNELAGAAPFSAVAFGRYELPLGEGRRMQLTASAKYLDAFYTKVENFGTSRQPAYTLVSARAALRFAGGLDVAVWGKNLLNEEYTTVTFLGFGSDTYYIADPRTWGIDVRYSF